MHARTESYLLNRLLLAKIIEEIENFITYNKIIITPDKKAKAISIIYDHAIKNKHYEIDQSSIKDSTSMILTALD